MLVRDMPALVLRLTALIVLGIFSRATATPAPKTPGDYLLSERGKGQFALAAEVTVLGQPRRIEFVFADRAKANAAAVLLSYAVEYMPRVAEKFGVAPAMEVFRVEDIADGTTTRARNDGPVAHVPFILKDTNAPLGPALLYHELTHWWFPYSPRWLSEGASSYLPLAMDAAGLLSLSENDRAQLLEWWGLRRPNPKPDIPLNDDERKNLSGDYGFAINYEKAFKIQYLLHHELGTAGYFQFLQTLMAEPPGANENWVPYSEHAYGQGTGGILNLLKKQKPVDWKAFLSGWLIQPVYKVNPPAAFLDIDGDSLLDIEERYLGTNPGNTDTDGDGLNDGAEVSLKLDPRVKNSADEIARAFASRHPVLDGIDDDWKYFPALVFSSPTAKGVPAPMDFSELRVIVINGILYGNLASRAPMDAKDPNTKKIYFFLNDASEPKVRDGLGFWYSPGARRGWEYGRKSGAAVSIDGRVGRVFEFAFDVSEWKGKVLKLVPVIRPNAKGENIGYWDQYKPVEIPIP